MSFKSASLLFTVQLVIFERLLLQHHPSHWRLTFVFSFATESVASVPLLFVGLQQSGAGFYPYLRTAEPQSRWTRSACLLDCQQAGKSLTQQLFWRSGLPCAKPSNILYLELSMCKSSDLKTVSWPSRLAPHTFCTHFIKNFISGCFLFVIISWYRYIKLH